MKKLFLFATAFFSFLTMIQAQNTSPYWSLAGNSNATSSSKLGTTNAINLRLFTNNLERMRITSAGLVGVGTTAPNAKLHINSTSTQDPFRVQVNAATKLLVHKNGGVAIGVNATPPANGLLVNGHLQINNVIKEEDPAGADLGGTGIKVTAGETGIRVSASDFLTGQGIVADGGVTGVHGEGDVFGIFGSSSDIGVHGEGYTGVEGISTYGLGGRFESYSGTGLSARTTSGFYAAIFYGNTYAYGTYYGSDKNIKKNIQEMDNAMSIINNLKPKSYEFKDDGPYTALHLPKGNHYGLLAQDVEAVLPNLVKESAHELRTAKPLTANKSTADSKSEMPTLKYAQKEQTENINIKAVNYIELIPIMIKAMQEQQQTIQQLQQENNAFQERVTKLEAALGANRNGLNTLPNAALIGTNLQQNQPNPFTHNTTFRYSIPNGANGQILVYDAAGKLVKTFIAPANGQMQMNASDLKPGVYVYSLVVDGKLAASKQMILSK